MMKQKIRIGLVLGILTAISLAALDRDFHAVGDGADAPAKLDVYRRAKGYTVLVTTDGHAATVTAKKAGKLVFTLDESGSVTLPDGKKAADDKKAADGTVDGDIYEVVAGDSLGKIAKKFYGDARCFDIIVNANQQLKDNPDKLRVGMKLVIPKI